MTAFHPELSITDSNISASVCSAQLQGQQWNKEMINYTQRLKTRPREMGSLM